MTEDQFQNFIISTVAEFIRTFDASLDPKLWLSLLEEEFAELEAELGKDPRSAETLKELVDVFYVFAPIIVLMDAAESAQFVSPALDERAKALLSRISEVGTKHVALFDRDVFIEAFKRVHASNMSKLGDDGKPIRREDGKIMKGPNYKAPDLSDLVKRKV